MKSLFTIALGFFVVFGSVAQTDIKIYSKKSGMEITGTQYSIPGDASKSLIKEDFKTVMTSHDSALISIKRRELSIVSGTSDYFCWFLCYGSVAAGSQPLWEAEDSLMLYKNDTVPNFSVYYEPNGKLGTACYQYVFIAENTPLDSVYLDVCFEILTIGVNEFEIADVKVFPNPSTDGVNVDIDSDDAEGAILRITDIQGKLVKTQRMTRGMNRVDESTLDNGTYIFQIWSSNNELIKEDKVIIE